jgi:gamma-glutamyltranspeptidase
MKLSATGERWAIATPHSPATLAGADAFERGGNAVDAALAAAIMLAVSYPQSTGIGGDLFALVQRPSGEVIAINASGRSPAALNVAGALAAGGGRVPGRGPLSITTPGTASGWEAIYSQGAVLPWADAFIVGISAADLGVETPSVLARALASEADLLAADEGLASIFFGEGRPLTEGEVFRQPALARTLDRIAGSGAAQMYEGEVGTALVEGLRALGSPISLDDLRSHRAELGSPLRARYRDLDVLVAPPNSQGFAMLEMLLAIERLEIDPDPFGTDAGALALTIRAAGADRDRHLADPGRMRIHPSELLDDGHIAAICDNVRSGVPRAGDPGAVAGGGDTVALVTADAEGNAVSLIQSLYRSFGSAILEPRTGIVAHDRAACFTALPGHPNELAPGVRPAHTLMPVLALRGGRPAIVAGTMGGHAQAQIDAMTLIRIVDMGLSPAEAVAMPRWLSAGLEPEDAGPIVISEDQVPRQVLGRLRAAGFDVLKSEDGGAGHAQAISITGSALTAGSDPRADGGALAS